MEVLETLHPALEKGASKALLEKLETSEVLLREKISVKDILPDGELCDKVVVFHKPAFEVEGCSLRKLVDSVDKDEDIVKYACSSSQFSLEDKELSKAMCGFDKKPKQSFASQFVVHLESGSEPLTIIYNSQKSKYICGIDGWKEAVEGKDISIVHGSPFASLGPCYSHWHMDSLRTPSLATLMDNGLGKKVGKLWLLLKHNVKLGRGWSKTPTPNVDGERTWKLTEEMVRHKDVEVCFLPVGYTLYFPSTVHHCVLTCYESSVPNSQKITGIAGVNFCVPKDKQQAQQALFSLSQDKIDQDKRDPLGYYMQICHFWMIDYPSADIQEDTELFKEYLENKLGVKKKKMSKKQKMKQNMLNNKKK